jgi:hypothetical protein
MWKVMEKIMVAQLSVIELHDSLHGGLPCRGMGTAIMKAKLNQQLAWVDQEPLYEIYLDLRKVYDALDWGQCLEILAGYGVGPNLLHLQKQFWDDTKMDVVLGAITGSPSEPTEMVCRRDLSPDSCSMFVSIVLLGSGSGKCWGKTPLETDKGRLRATIWLHSLLTMGWSQQDARSGCNHPFKSLLLFLNALDSEQTLKRLRT